MDRSNLIERTNEIADLARSLADELARRQLPEPSFEHGLPAPIQSDAPDSEALAARLKLLTLVTELQDLLTEPALLGSPELRNPSLSMLPLMQLGVFDNFPNEGISVPDLAQRIGLNEDLLRRLLSNIATYHIFFQSEPDFFVHTAGSRIICENEGMRSWMLLGMSEVMPSCLKITDALKRDPELQEPQNSGWSVNNQSEHAVFQAMASMPARASVFAKAMMWHGQQPGCSPQYLVENLPWAPGKTTIVDVGGGYGHIAHAILAHNPNTECIVQDRPEIIAQGGQLIPPDMKDRISLQAHDFFEDQPVHGADIYLLRHILHDWSRTYACKILKALVPAMKPGVKVVLNDRVIPGLGEAHYLMEREARNYDMYMLGLQNGQERTRGDWVSLLRDADPRFKLTRITKPDKSYLAIIEVTWE
ncbi:S-adenosyl-L-methionine-dependent methyltransferase, partial [Penicillium capsulatum]